MFRRILRLLIVINFVTFSWGWVQPVSAQSNTTTFTVTSNGDTGDAQRGDGVCATVNQLCTLRAAVDEAIALPGTQTVIIPAMTIYLSSELRLSTVPEGQASQDVSIIIQGAGENQTILDGGNRTRVFYFGINSGNHTISDLTIRNAENKNTGFYARNGGGIYNQGVLTLTNVTITGSRAFQGGGVFNEYDNLQSWQVPPKLILNHVKLTYNVATSAEVGFGGGGLFNGSIVEGDDVLISNNYADYAGGGFNNNTYHHSWLTNFIISNNTAHIGGGIHSDLTIVTRDRALLLEHGVISGNKAICCHPVANMVTGGGGIFNNQSYMILTDVALFENKVPNDVKVGGYGGAIANAQFMELEGVSITGNQACIGAGVYNGNNTGWPNQMSLVNVTISGNLGENTFPDSEGAAIFNINNGKISLINATITNNQADATGGIKNHSTYNTRIEMTNSILAGNRDSFKAEDCRGTIYSQGYNIIKNYLGNPSKNMPCNVNPQTTDMLGIIPIMGPLIGSPAYHPLLQGSEAIDKGTILQCPQSDIRGVQRPQGAACDIGSYEWTSGPADLFQLYLPITIHFSR